MMDTVTILRASKDGTCHYLGMEKPLCLKQPLLDHQKIESSSD